MDTRQRLPIVSKQSKIQSSVRYFPPVMQPQYCLLAAHYLATNRAEGVIDARILLTRPQATLISTVAVAMNAAVDHLPRYCSCHLQNRPWPPSFPLLNAKLRSLAVEKSRRHHRCHQHRDVRCRFDRLPI
jgi:hypothetical protein